MEDWEIANQQQLAQLQARAAAPTVDWQKLYVPMNGGIGTSKEYEAQVNAERLRQAMLQAQQINQASATTQGMQQAVSGAGSVGNTSSIASGSYALPGGGVTGGSYSLPGLSGVTGSGGVGTNIPVTSTALQQQYDPWSQYRPQASSQLAGEMGQTSPSDIYQQKLAQMTTGEFSPDDPSYAWRFQQGQQAAERSLASRGLLNSGNAAIELQQYGQGAASQEYGAQFNRMLQGLSGTEDAYNTQMNRLMQMAGVNLDPTAGGQLAVQAGNLGVAQGQLGVNASQVAGQYDLGMRELILKQQLAQMAQANQGVGGMSGTDWSSVFNTGRG